MKQKYRVTVQSRDGEFQIGDIISFEDDGTILKYNAQGWIDACNVFRSTDGMQTA